MLYFSKTRYIFKLMKKLFEKVLKSKNNHITKNDIQIFLMTKKNVNVCKM